MHKTSLTPINITEISYNELSYRVRMALDAVDLYYFYGHGLREVNSYSFDETIEYKTRNIISQFAFLQVCSLFNSGSFSLSPEITYKYKNRKTIESLTVGIKRLNTLFPIFSNTEIVVLQRNINEVFKKHIKTINTIYLIRNKRIGHMGEIIHKTRSDEDYIMFSHQSPIPKSFRYISITKLCYDLREHFLDEVQDKIEFYDS